MNGNALVIAMTSVVLHPALAAIQQSNPPLFEKLMARLQHRPQFGTVTISFTEGRLSHIRTEVSDR